MKVLIACEESQRVCIEFRKLGHEAYSCDIQECSGGHPEWHIMDDVLPLLNGHCSFKTMDGVEHTVTDKWGLIIAHPPCTYLSNSSAVRLYKKINGETYINRNRFELGLQAKEFFMTIYSAECDKIAIENPVPTGIYHLPKYTQIIQPYEYGEPWLKKTCLWLKGIPVLRPTNIVEPIGSWVSGGCKKSDGSPRSNKGTTFRDSKRKSKTFPGIAQAMAQQWGGEI